MFSRRFLMFSKNRLISFFANGYQYQAESGMTWGEFLASSYNAGLQIFYLDSDGYVKAMGYNSYVRDHSYSKLTSNSIIIEDHYYTY